MLLKACGPFQFLQWNSSSPTYAYHCQSQPIPHTAFTRLSHAFPTHFYAVLAHLLMFQPIPCVSTPQRKQGSFYRERAHPSHMLPSIFLTSTIVDFCCSLLRTLLTSVLCPFLISHFTLDILGECTHTLIASRSTFRTPPSSTAEITPVASLASICLALFAFTASLQHKCVLKLCAFDRTSSNAAIRVALAVLGVHCRLLQHSIGITYIRRLYSYGFPRRHLHHAHRPKALLPCFTANTSLITRLLAFAPPPAHILLDASGHLSVKKAGVLF